MEPLRLIKNKKVVTESFDTRYQKEFEKDFAVGETVSVKLPQRFLVSDGMGYQPQGINRIVTTVTLDQWIQIAFEVDDLEKALKQERSKEEIRKNYLEPLADQFCQEIDSRAAKFAYQNANNVVGALGTDATTWNNAFSARRRLQELGNLPGKKRLCINPSLMQSMVQNNFTQFNPTDAISKAFKEGYMGHAAGWDWFESVALWQHTAGTWAGAVVIAGAGQSGNSLIITATAGDTFKKGDKISIANVNQVNTVTRRAIGATAKNFTIMQDLTAAGGAGADTLSIQPAIFGPGSQYQNVDALPAAGAALTLWPGTGTPNGKVGTLSLGLTEYGFALVGAKLYDPTAVEVCMSMTDPATGLHIRFVKAWDPFRSVLVQRADMLIGFGNLHNDPGAVVVAGA